MSFHQWMKRWGPLRLIASGMRSASANRRRKPAISRPKSACRDDESRRCSKDSSIDESPLAVKKRLEKNRRKHDRSGLILAYRGYAATKGMSAVLIVLVLVIVPRSRRIERKRTRTRNENDWTVTKIIAACDEVDRYWHTDVPQELHGSRRSQGRSWTPFRAAAISGVAGLPPDSRKDVGIRRREIARRRSARARANGV